jgi:Protein of unknown function (DUF2442)
MKTRYLPAVVRAKHVRSYLLEIHFDDGTQKLIDISQWFKGPVFEPLKSLTYFKKFFVEAATLAWPNGVDISPEALYSAQDHQSAVLRPRAVMAKKRSRVTYSSSANG